MIVIIFFNFLDIIIFQYSRSFHGLFFIFFQEVIDPLSDVFDPLNLILICTLILFININIKRIISNENKLEVIKKNTQFSFKKIISLFNFSLLFANTLSYL